MPRRLAVVFAAGLSLLAALPARAQSAVSLTGTVTTREDGLPLPGATVAIESLGLSALTDAQGRYRLEGPAPAVGETGDLKGSAPGPTPRGGQGKLVGALRHDLALGLGFHEEVTGGP